MDKKSIKQFKLKLKRLYLFRQEIVCVFFPHKPACNFPRLFQLRAAQRQRKRKSWHRMSNGSRIPMAIISRRLTGKEFSGSSRRLRFGCPNVVAHEAPKAGVGLSDGTTPNGASTGRRRRWQKVLLAGSFTCLLG